MSLPTAFVILRPTASDGDGLNDRPLRRLSYDICGNGPWSVTENDGDRPWVRCDVCTGIAEVDYEVIKR